MLDYILSNAIGFLSLLPLLIAGTSYALFFVSFASIAFHSVGNKRRKTAKHESWEPSTTSSKPSDARCARIDPLVYKLAHNNMSKSRHQDLFGKIGVIQDDTILHICSYLTPMSITNLACVNKATNELVDDHTQTLSHSIWQLLWFRDYGDVLLGWETSRNAVLKSLRRDHDEGSNNNNCAAVNTSEQPSLATPNLANMVVNALREKNTKEFYFRFQLAFVDYILAGQNSESRCLMGIHGHIFDFTDFAPNHPGLSEPIQLECGKDVTHFFEDVRHSKGARRIAQRLCLIVDKSRLNDYTSNDNDLPCGLYCPSRNSKNLTKFLRETNTRPPSPDESHPPSLRIDNLLPMMIRPTFGSQGRIRTLQTYQRRHQYERSQLPLAKPVSDKYAVRLYYDPFLGRWRGWHWKDEGQYSQVVFTNFDLES